MSLFVGIDYGSSSLKVGVYDQQGSQILVSRQEMPVERLGPGCVQGDVEAGWRALTGCIRRHVKSLALDAGEVAGICAVGTSNLTLLDDRLRALRPPILYADQRLPPVADIEEIVRKIGAPRLGMVLGFGAPSQEELSTVLALMSSSKLLWLRANEPSVFSRAKLCLRSGQELIASRLTGRAVQVADGFPLDEEICSLFGMPPQFFGEFVEVGEVVGGVTNQAANETGLKEGTPVIMGSGDSLGACLGAGLSNPGKALNHSGTTDVVALVVNGRPESSFGYPVRHLIPGLWLLSLSPVRGEALEWFRTRLMPASTEFHQIDELAAGVAPGSDGLVCLPCFAGEKSVHHDTAARGVLVGLDMRHGKGHLARAIMEGIAFGLREILEAYSSEGFEADEIRLSGGGARSRLWNQIRADVLGRPVAVTHVAETGCLGAAILAATALGYFKDRVEAASFMARIQEVLEPDPRNAETYDRAYRVYRSLYSANKEAFVLLKQQDL